MLRCGLALASLVLVSGVMPGAAEDRAWQQRLDVEIPLPVPPATVASENPFVVPVDTPPSLLHRAQPGKLDVRGEAVAAAYVDADGECLGAVPLTTPFPGLAAALVEELGDARFEPAKVGSTAASSWVVLSIGMEGRVKDSEVLDETLALPEPGPPPEPTVAAVLVPAGAVAQLPATPADELTALASPRRLRVRVPNNEVNIRAHALVHVTAEGRCDRYVLLDLPSGLERWFASYLASWNLEPARRGGAAVDSWMEYRGSVRMKLSGLDETGYRVLGDRIYTPPSGS